MLAVEDRNATPLANGKILSDPVGVQLVYEGPRSLPALLPASTFFLQNTIFLLATGQFW